MPRRSELVEMIKPKSRSRLPLVVAAVVVVVMAASLTVVLRPQPMTLPDGEHKIYNIASAAMVGDQEIPVIIWQSKKQPLTERIRGAFIASVDAASSDTKDLWLINGAAATLTLDGIMDMAQRDEVARIEPDYKVRLHEQAKSGNLIQSVTTELDNRYIGRWGVEDIGAPKVWNHGVDGAGVVVAVIDTGVDANHYELKGKVVGWRDFVNGRPQPYDDLGHGTHVAGVIAGRRFGVAPEAQLLVAKVFDQYGEGSTSGIIQAFQWAIANGADVINFSGGATEYTDLWDYTLSEISKRNVIPVIAAGNFGPAPRTICTPGNVRGTITVGAVDRGKVIAPFSSRGPSSIGGGRYIKPDVCAPGVDVRSCWPGGGYRTLSGTSQAAAHVTGATALLLQEHRGMSMTAIKSVLEGTSTDLGAPGADNKYGAGMIDAYGAFAAS